METHTITTYRLASDKFLRTYFPESAYGLTPNPSMKFKRESVNDLFRTEKSQLIHLFIMGRLAFCL